MHEVAGLGYIIIKYLYSYTHKNIKYLNAVYIDLH